VPSKEDIISTVEAYAAAQTSGDVDAVVALFAPDAVVADPVHEPAHVGREAIHTFFSGTRDMVDSMVLEVTGPIRAVDRYAAVPLRAVSDIGGSRVAVDIVDVFTFEDNGLIGDMKAYWDPAGITPVD
jgi:steroid delta-isomerase